ncbi:hypothetical protein CEP54_011369 [Fusarium duplospermum]|uniref:Major facilitator superfamily (MFS) profile domain-containing protein n=1 Tax=Fusarium duplospermum TaxID=1325734 RepID=A0A428PEV8_9HYPO|nr:hypothetical protein CEP54_011369 [Fusarium duplospermum]
MSGIAGLAGWRWLFILQGIITFIVSIISLFILPDEPQNTRWLSQEERNLAASRIAEDTVRLKANTITWAGLVEALRDPYLWVLLFIQHLHLAASNFKNFFPSIVETLGFSRNVTLALTCPPYLVSGIISIAWAASSGHFNERTREKKAISLAIVNTFASISAIYGPYLWPKWNAPRYTIPMLASAAFSIGAVFLAWLLRWMLVRANKKLLQQSGEIRPNLYPY